MSSEIAHFDGNVYVDTILPKYYSEETAGRLFDGFNTPSYHLEDAQAFIKEQDEKNMQLLVAKSISSNKEYIIQMLENKVRGQGMDMDIRNLRVMVK